jgi:hypothetical protein
MVLIKRALLFISNVLAIVALLALLEARWSTTRLVALAAVAGFGALLSHATAFAAAAAFTALLARTVPSRRTTASFSTRSGGSL